MQNNTNYACELNSAEAKRLVLIAEYLLDKYKKLSIAYNEKDILVHKLQTQLKNQKVSHV